MTVDLHPPEMTKSGRSGRQEIFLELLDGVYVDLHAYVRSLILNRSDSDDVLQDVCVVLWTKFDEFEFGTSFRKWALAVAYQRARAYWRDCKRYRGFALTEQVLAKFSQAFDASIEIQEIRERLLTDCIEKLPARDRAVVQNVYFEGVTPADAAASRGVSASAIYNQLSRVRQKIGACVDRSLS